MPLPRHCRAPRPLPRSMLASAIDSAAPANRQLHRKSIRPTAHIGIAGFIAAHLRTSAGAAARADARTAAITAAKYHINVVLELELELELVLELELELELVSGVVLILN